MRDRDTTVEYSAEHEMRKAQVCANDIQCSDAGGRHEHAQEHKIFLLRNMHSPHHGIGKKISITQVATHDMACSSR